MPEVAEVALSAEILSHYFLNKQLLAVDLISGRYTKILPNGTQNKPKGYDEFVQALPLKLTKIDSKGKLLWFEYKNAKGKMYYVMNTFGLHGLWSTIQPRHLRVAFSFSNNMAAYYGDQINYGTFQFTDNKDILDKKLKSLGPDFLKDDNFTLDKITSYDKPVVELLMDQKKLGSGIGNYLVAEILYRAKISPHRKGSSLKPKEIRDLTYWIKYITKLSYAQNDIGYMVNLAGDVKKLKKKNYHPDIVLDGNDFEFQIYKQKNDPLGNPVKADSIIKGRNTYWVPAIQR
jgi:formamidopyrimidine-DNA glycosylase